MTDPSHTIKWKMTDPFFIQSGYSKGKKLMASSSSDISPKMSDSSDPSPVSLLLNGQQRALLRALGEKSPQLSTMYRGGLLVLSEISNPERFPLCSHSMRELMEKLPAHLDVPITAHKEKMKDKVIELEKAFNKEKKNTSCFDQKVGWNGTIDKPLTRFLNKFEAFIDWFEKHNPRRRKEVHQTLERLDGSGRVLPDALASLNSDQWLEINQYFQSIAHHDKETTEKEIKQWLDSFERFLLDRLVPRTFEEFSVIDSLIGEAKDNAKS